MKKVSEAANGIWDFQLIGGDFNTSSPTVLQLVDMNYTGSKPVHRLKEKAWVFPVHRGDSIVRAMDWSNELSNEIAAATVFSVPGTGENEDSLLKFYEENKDDMIFIKKAKMDADENESNVTTATKQSGITSTTQSQIDSAGTKEEIPDSEKFIIAQSTFKEILTQSNNKVDESLKLPIKWTNSGFILRGGWMFGKNKENFGHNGWGGSLGFADPINGMGIAYVTRKINSGMNADTRALKLIIFPKDIIFVSLFFRKVRYRKQNKPL